MPRTVEWRDIPGYEGLYRVSSDGQVLSLRRIPTMLLRLSSRNRYLFATLCDGGKRKVIGVHRLVGLAFHSETHFAGAFARHLDDDRTNNSAENIAWGTQSDNMRDAARNKRFPAMNRTECISGHPFDAENTRWRIRRGQRHRVCRACKRADDLRRRLEAA